MKIELWDYPKLNSVGATPTIIVGKSKVDYRNIHSISNCVLDECQITNARNVNEVVRVVVSIEIVRAPAFCFSQRLKRHCA